MHKCFIIFSLSTILSILMFRYFEFDNETVENRSRLIHVHGSYLLFPLIYSIKFRNPIKELCIPIDPVRLACRNRNPPDLR